MTVISTRLGRTFAEAWHTSRVILFSAPCGCGKTTSAMALLKNRPTLTISFANGVPIGRTIPKGTQAVFVDDIQLLTDPDQQQRLVALMRTHQNLRFVLLGRCRTPGWLMPFQLAGDLFIIDIDDLVFDLETTRRLFESHDISLSQQDLLAIHRDFKGYPIALTLLVSRLEGSQSYQEISYVEAKHDLFVYFEEVVFSRLPQPTRRLLIACAFLDSFDIDLAKTVSGDSHAGEIISSLLRESSMLLIDGLGTFRFKHIFKECLEWEATQRITDEERRENCRRAAIHYELEDDVSNALDCYTKAGDFRKVREMLERNSELHPGIGHFIEMERYYFSLPHDEVRKSPSLMCGMSMLSAMSLDFDSSDKWYGELKDYLATVSRNDLEYADVRGKLAYLDIALPQGGSEHLAGVIRDVASIIGPNQAAIPRFSVTSTLPSIMNGGKDFCSWSKTDDLLYATMRKPVEKILGPDGVGLADCAICESKFEKGQDVSMRLLTLMSQLGEIQARGTPDIDFALEGLLARVQVSQGKAMVALSSLENLRTRFLERGETRFLPNIDAMICRIRLRLGDIEQTAYWLERHAPADGERLWVFWRYRYITKMGVLIAQNRCDEALLVAAQLHPYFIRCDRVMDELTIRLLSAICNYRLGNDTWRSDMKEALDTCHAYSFVTPVAQLGVAILPLLEKCEWNDNASFLAKVTSATRTQAIRYPRLFASAPSISEPLSAAELQVLDLICSDLSNKRIAETLGIKLPTVKTHVSHILRKLDVSSRAEARNVARELHLV